MYITVIGAGAIGGVIGAYLIREGHKVTFCDIVEEHVNAMNELGLTIDGEDETFTVPCTAFTPEQLLSRIDELDTIFLCVKAQHTEEALRPFLPYISEHTKVVSFQNGLCENIIARLVGAEKTIGCFVNFSADYLGPGKILYGGVAALYLGELDGRISKRVLDLQSLLKCWGPVQVTDNIWGYLWGKLSYAGLLYATALVDETMAGVVRNIKYRDALMELCSEILEIADKEQITPVGFDDWEPSLVYPRAQRDQHKLDEQLQKLANRMASNKKSKSGIWRDLAVRKRKTEIDFQLVPIIEMAKKHQVQMPLTETLISLIKEIEEGTIQMSWENLDILNDIFEKSKLQQT
jgi:2-dehydropantoate 2-reductase